MLTRRLFLAATVLLGALVSSPTWADEPELPTVDSLLNAFETNLNFETRSATLTMTVANPRRTREYSMTTFGRGADESTIEYLSPARERGTRYLRKGEEMWMYLPAVERVQKISGHMLRQGMAGSDVSYEDMTSSTEWQESYEGVLVGQEVWDTRPHWRIELTAKTSDVTYAKRVILVDVETLIPSHQELYALSGLMVKTWDMTDVRPLEDGRQYPFRMRIEDKLKEGSYTEIVTTELEMGVALEEEVFSLRWLERG
ncbi:MAG: outer membrane lipoprotein-sorting protein [Myxococcota bacterium]|jgi:outer membrane lipoprotein-sorting protein